MATSLHIQRSRFQPSNSGPVSRTCRFCFKNFSKAEHLSRHERSHTKERPYRCKDCGKCYSRNDTLLRHGRVHNKGKGQDYDVLSSPSRLDAAAANPIDLQILTEHGQGMMEPVSSIEDAQNNNLVIDPSLRGHNRQNSTVERATMNNLLSNPMLDQNMQDASQNSQNDSFMFQAQPELCNMEAEFHYPSWHIDEDFDLQAFNTSLLAPAFVDESTWRVASPEGQGAMVATPRLGLHSRSATSLDVIQRLWVTKADENFTNRDELSYSVAPRRTRMSTMICSANRVDERYQENLLLRLQPRLGEGPLPSAEFLNRALQLFFTKFNPMFPILHAPTFRPSNHNSLLLLSICSIGSLFMGSNGATVQGSNIFEGLNKAILASWGNIASRQSVERTSLVQAAVISQTFAYLSGSPNHLATVESFHGTIISWARRIGMFNVTQVQPPPSNALAQELDESWREWAKSEETTRAVLGLYIHDAQLATMFHRDPILRHNVIRLTVAASNEVFEAPNALQWANLMRIRTGNPGALHQHLHINQPEHRPSQPLPRELDCGYSRFSCYVILHGIGASVHETNQAGQMREPDVERYRDALICWYYAYEAGKPAHEYDPFCLMILWHEIFMSLFVNFDELERAIGRGGSSEAAQAMLYAGPWATSTDAKRCVIHASLIHRHIGIMCVDSEPAIHVPRCMFLAAIAWYCYLQFGDEGSPPVPAEENFDFPEVKILNVNPFQHLFEASGFKKGKPAVFEASPLCGLTDLLHRLGHWDIARRFARILDLSIHGGTDGHLDDVS